MSLAERDAGWAIAGTGWTEARANPNRFTYLRKDRQEGPAPGPAREVTQQRTTVEPRTMHQEHSRHLVPAGWHESTPLAVAGPAVDDDRALD